MPGTDIVVPMSSVTKQIEAKIIIKGWRTFNWRFWLALRVLRVARMIMPVHTDIEIRD